MIDIQALAMQCGLEPRGFDYERETGRWDEDTDLHIICQDGVSMPFLLAFARAVLEEAAEACEAVHPDYNLVLQAARDQCAAAVRALGAFTVGKPCS